MFLLSLGVIFGYGGAIASARWHAHHGCDGRWGEHSRFEDRRFDDQLGQRAQPTPQPQTVVVQPAAPAAAPAPQIFVIMPGAAAPQAVTQVAAPVVATPAPAASPAPATP
jgi:hypothetical protein